jgi:predicted GIY-YIG superfamily endonuclease
VSELARLAAALGVEEPLLQAIADGPPTLIYLGSGHPDGGDFSLRAASDFAIAVAYRECWEAVQAAYGPRSTAAAPPTRQRRRSSSRRPFILYRLRDPEGRLLYVGVTRDLKARLKAHRRDYGAALASVEREEFDTPAEAVAAELRAIANEQPLFNAAGVGETPYMPPAWAQ